MNSLTPDCLTLVLSEELVRIRAQEAIVAAYSQGKITVERWRSLWLAATGDVDTADRAAGQLMMAQMRAGQSPE